MVERYPISATVSWRSARVQDASGYISATESNTVTFKCNVQQAGGDYSVGQSADIVTARWQIFTKLTDDILTVPDGADITFDGKTYKILRFWAGQVHVEILCG